MAVIYHKGIFSKIEDETPTVKKFTITFPELDEYKFQAGQFLMLDLPINSKITNRSYSIASAPNGTNTVELVIVLKEDGLGTPYLFKLKEGAEVKVSSPIGKYFLPDPITKDICLISTGTGIAPHRSFIEYIANNNIPHKKIYIIVGHRYEDELQCRKELEAIEKRLPNFKYIKVLSRATKETWDGHLGYVHPIYQEMFKDKRPAHFYICGWRNMIIQARDNIKAMGYEKADIKFELYD